MREDVAGHAAPAPLGATLLGSAERKPSEIPSRTQSVSAFLLGRASVDTPLLRRSSLCVLPRPSRISAIALLFVCGLVSLAISPGAADDGKEVKEVVKKLQARYEQTRDLKADFKQSTKIEGFATPITSRGRVYIKKPGLLRWDYLDPAVEEIYVNENEVMMYVPEHKQVLVGKLTQMAASQAPLQLLQGVAKLEEQFALEASAGGKRGEGGVPLVTLLPKETELDPVRTVARIVLEVQPKTYFIKTLSIHEISGNVSTFEFNNLKPNTGLKNALFEFETPAGVEVVKAPALSPP
jgi:outer membrane lipoprotein carrier protein